MENKSTKWRGTKEALMYHHSLSLSLSDTTVIMVASVLFVLFSVWKAWRDEAKYVRLLYVFLLVGERVKSLIKK